MILLSKKTVSILTTTILLISLFSSVRQSTAVDKSENSNAPLLAEEIVRTTVSGCYQNDGSKTTVSVVIDWETVGELTVSLDDGDQVRTIAPEYTITATREIPTLQEIAFELEADGSKNHTIEVYYTTDADTIIASTSFNVPTPCEPTICDEDDLGGMIFQDFNLNGARESSETQGLETATVTAIDVRGNSYTTVTDRFGLYKLTIPAEKYPVRVEFSDIPYSPYLSTSTPAGSDNGTTVQFVSAPACTIDLGVTNPLNSCGTDDPLVVTSCYANGDPLATDTTGASVTAGSMDVLVGLQYSESGLTPTLEHIAYGSDMGATWGQAYNVVNETLYSAAFYRRHVGLGPDGLGAIYATDMSDSSNYASTTFVDLMDGTFTIDLGSVDSNADRGLVADVSKPSADPQAFVDTGKVGIGDIDVDPFSDILWFVNFNQQALHSLVIDSDDNANTSPKDADLDTYIIPDIGCQNGIQRPWATKVYDGGVYVGVVCDASSGTREDLQAGVLRYDLLTGWDVDPILQFPLTYPKGEPHEDSSPALWNPWTDDWADTYIYRETKTDLSLHPQPIFSDIEFDIDGSMVLAFADRNGFQAGWYNVDPEGEGEHKSFVGGDLLRAYYGGNGVYILENNGTAGPFTGYGADNSQGPGLGEFYNDNFNGNNHSENSMGSIALLPGSGQVVSTHMDPIDGTINSGGVRYLNNRGANAGLTDHAANIYTSDERATGTLGKAAGLGDLELICRLPEVLEIGNRIWLDANEDGIQDPDEDVAPDVTVILYDVSGNEVARRDTDADGIYYFDVSDGLLPNTDYYVVVDSEEFVSGDLVDWIYPTLPFGGASQHDSNVLTLFKTNDSSLPNSLEASLGASVTTGNYNENNHTIDMGFAAEPVIPIIGDTVWLDTDKDGEQDSDELGVPNVIVHLYNDEGVLLNTTTTNEEGRYIFNTDSRGENLIPDDFYIVVEPPAGYVFTDKNATDDITKDSNVDPITGISDQIAVGANEVNLTFDAGLVPVMSLGSTVFYDDDKNGFLNDSEIGIADVIVELYDNNDNLLRTTTTSKTGKYYFDGLEPGQYYIRIPNPPEDAPSSSTNTSTDPDDDVDNDDNGIQIGGSGAPVVSNLITLIGNSEPTNETGSGSGKDDANESNGNMTVDFGFVNAFAALGNFVWLDVSEDGVQDAGESGIANVIVTLTPPVDVDLGNGDGVAITTTTNNDGKYLFDNLPPADGYVISIDETQSVLADASLEYSVPNNSGNSNQADLGNQDPTGYTVDLSSSEADLSGDFGYKYNLTPLAVSLQGGQILSTNMMLLGALVLCIVFLLGFVFYRRRSLLIE